MRTWGFPWLLIGLLCLLALYASISSGSDGGPPLEVSTPIQNVAVNNSTMSVKGTTSPNATINVTLESILGTRTYNSIAEPDGTFEVEVELFEGYQKVHVTLTARATIGI